jgi:thiamine biosynthesis lipoprotein ApbE
MPKQAKAATLEAKVERYFRAKERANKIYREAGTLFDSIVQEMNKKNVDEVQISPDQTYALVDHFKNANSMFKNIRADRYELKPKRYA